MKGMELPASGKKNWQIMVMLALSMLLASLGTSIVNIALPTLADAFSASFAHVQGVIVAYLAALTVSTVMVGRLGDIYGLRLMHLAGLVVFSIASLLCGLALDLWFLIAARAIQGIGAAILMTLAMALMRETAGEDRIGRAMGLLGTMSALGTALGPSLGGMLIPLIGWRGVFLVLVPLTLLALILAFVSLPHKQRHRTGYHANPRTKMNKNLAPNLMVNLLVAAVMMTTLVVGPFYLSRGRGLSETLVGLIMSAGPIISIVSGVPSGRAVDVRGPRHIMALGLALLGTGSLLLSILPGMIGVAGYVLAIAVLTPGYQLFQAANNTAALADVAKDQRGLVSGLLSLSRNIGLIVGAAAMGAVFAFGVGTGNFRHASPSAIENGMQITFLCAAGLVAIAFGIAFGKPIGTVVKRVNQTLSLRHLRNISASMRFLDTTGGDP